MADMCEKLYLNLTLEEPSSTVTKFANSVDPVEMAPLDLQCLLY